MEEKLPLNEAVLSLFSFSNIHPHISINNASLAVTHQQFGLESLGEE
jgi:hypothetical protein